MRQIDVYEDRLGNTLRKRYVKSRDVWQLYATNKEGRFVNKVGVKIMINKARKAGVFGLPNVDIHGVSDRIIRNIL